MSLLVATLLGVGLGVKHAFEADHVAAVCTFVARGDGVTRAARCGALWGAGHGAVIVLAGGALIASGLAVPVELAVALELCVAATLVILGLHSILRAGTSRPGSTARGTGTSTGADAASARSPAGALPAPAGAYRRPFLVGLLHGASGTAALTVLVTSSLAARVEALAFVAVFGAASVVGMTAVAAGIAWPLGAVLSRAPWLGRGVNGLAGAGSIVSGLVLAVATLGLSSAL